jgi:hypothetical protein
MKKKRRVVVQIEHCEFSMFAATGAAQMGQDGSEPKPSKPEVCPTCGSAGMLPLAEAVLMGALNVATLQSGAENGSVHLHCAASREWWVCKQSLHPR